MQIYLSRRHGFPTLFSLKSFTQKDAGIFKINLQMIRLRRDCIKTRYLLSTFVKTSSGPHHVGVSPGKPHRDLLCRQGQTSGPTDRHTDSYIIYFLH